ncbi:MAG: DUF4136 domain-containing protein [Bacteroidota bacterium]
MRKRFIIFGIALASMTTSCYGPDNTIYTEDLDVIYSQKKEGYDFNTGEHGNKKELYALSDTVSYIDSKGDPYKIPDEDGNGHENLSVEEAVKMIGAVRSNMNNLGWREFTDDISNPPTEEDIDDLKALVLMNIVTSKTTYVGGGYYPGYPGWGWGYPWYGWSPWIPYYYSYSLGSVIVTMVEPLDPSDSRTTDDVNSQLIWETVLSGFIRNGIEIDYIVGGIDQGFDQSSEYLQR